MKKYVFRDCTLAVLEEEFGIREVFTLDNSEQLSGTAHRP